MTSKTASALDLFERLLILALYAWLVTRVVAPLLSGEGGLGNLLQLPSEGLVLVFVLVRRRTVDVSRRAWEWALAIVATAAPMLAGPSPGHPLAPPAMAGGIIVAGTLVQLHAKLVLGRSFGCVPANRGVKIAGPYRFVRHPMYAGYMLSHLGFTLMNPSLWNLAMYSVCAAIQIPRLHAEERLLEQADEYRRYRSAVPYRLVPGIY